MEGIRVLEVAEHTFVPAAAAILSDWGADVVKIEHAQRGDAMRGLASSGVMKLGAGNVHVLMEHANRGKRSLALDLGQPEGLEILYRLAASADVFLTNKMPGVRKRLNIDVGDIRRHNPSIVYVRGSGYGARGPEADRGGYDFLGFWARGGSAVGVKDHGATQLPNQPGPGYGDTIGSMTIAGGIAAALLHRERTGEAAIVDVSLLSTGMWAMAPGIALSRQLDEPWLQPPPIVKNPLTTVYRTKDDRWIALSCLQGFHYWPDMCRVLGRDELVADERFATAEALMANATEAGEILAGEFAGRTLAEWGGRLADFTGQWSPVQSSLEVLDDPQAAANGYLQEVRAADGSPFTLVTTPVQFDEQPAAATRGPEFNEHGDEILRAELGLDDETLVDLKVRGVVG